MNIYLIVFIVYFGIIIATSIMGSKKVESMEDFAVGGNKMGLLLGVGTSMATWLSVASVMGVPGNIYSRGVCAITGWIAGWFFATAVMPNIINLRLDITHLYYPAKNSFQKGRLKRREIFTELLLYTLTT